MSAYYYHSREQDPSTLHNLNGFRDIRQTEDAPHWPFNGDLSLRTLDLGGGEGKFLPQAEGAYQPSYHAVNSPSGYSRSKPAALPPRTKSPPRQPTNLMRDFVHMNEAYITTDLPEETPFGLVPTDARAPSFQNHPYPDGHRWPQTFKITEVKQIGPKKQTLACFFCRSRKIACAPRPVDGTEDRSCEYVADFEVYRLLTDMQTVRASEVGLQVSEGIEAWTA
ncbi:hypothetical protein B0H15DRAFT_800988 [Mycena belliarum]|uniref:Uncharacterized protein n=1 Tax=Mycena belliarum TaxID=1033014 RepID=A0AAD6XRM9_9AGAR|nr:hypothetical protein B0H15DRAFT_800988 [Mycena belliae]